MSLKKRLIEDPIFKIAHCLFEDDEMLARFFLRWAMKTGRRGDREGFLEEVKGKYREIFNQSLLLFKEFWRGASEEEREKKRKDLFEYSAFVVSFWGDRSEFEGWKNLFIGGKR